MFDPAESHPDDDEPMAPPAAASVGLTGAGDRFELAVPPAEGRAVGGDEAGDGPRGEGAEGGSPLVGLSLEERRALAHAVVDRVFAEGLSGAEASAVIVARSELATLVDGAALEALPRWEASVAWRNEGYASPASWLVGHTGARRAAMAALRRCAHGCAALPALETAVASGAVSLEHLGLLVAMRRRCERTSPRVRDRFDADIELLLGWAQRMHVEAFGRALALWYLQTLVDLEENEPDTPPDDLTEASTLRMVRSFQGRGLLTGDLTAEHLVALTEAIDARIARWRTDGQLDDDPRPLDELQAAALLELIAEAAVANRRGAARPLVIVTATLAALFERARIGSRDRDRWAAEILGGGPLGAKALRDLLERADVQLIVTDDDGKPLHVGRAQRLATAAMYAALVAMTGGRCEHPSCSAPHHRCHAHHIVWWSRGGETSLQNLALLCPHHHRLVHDDRHTIERQPDGTLQWRRPDGTTVDPPPFQDTT